MAPLQIGIMLEAVQVSDISCIDIIGNMSTDAAEAVAPFAPAGFSDLKANAVGMVFHYISSSLSPAFLTPSIHVVPTVTYDSCPRDLDILLIGGPLPSHRPEAADRFLKEALGVDGKGEEGKRVKTVLTTCTGSMWLASSGALDGKRATTNRMFLPMARELYPKVEWVDQRWVVHEDGDVTRFWTSGGAMAGEFVNLIESVVHFRMWLFYFLGRNLAPALQREVVERSLTDVRVSVGNDMVAHYALQTFHKGMVASSLEGLDLDPNARGQFYKSVNVKL